MHNEVEKMLLSYSISVIQENIYFLVFICYLKPFSFSF